MYKELSMYYRLNIPPLPTFNQGGKALFHIGDNHPHRTNLGSFDLMIVESGCLYIQDENERYVVKAQETILLHPHQTHSSFRPCDTPSHIHWLHFDFNGDFVKTPHQKFIPSNELLLPIQRQLTKNDFQNILILADKLEEWISDPAINGKMKQRNRESLDELDKHITLLKLLKILANLPESDFSVKDISSQIDQYLSLNYPYEITLTDLAQNVHCHPSQIIRNFKKDYGITPFKRLQDIRLMQAKNLLQNTNLPINQIALQIGYNSSAYFTKVFREHYGSPPSSYRKI